MPSLRDKTIQGNLLFHIGIASMDELSNVFF